MFVIQWGEVSEVQVPDGCGRINPENYEGRLA